MTHDRAAELTRSEATEPTSARKPTLATSYLGLSLSGPVIASAGPLTGHVASLQALERAGAAAVVLPSLFEEEIIAEEVALERAFAAGEDFYPEFSGMLPEVELPDLGPERHVRLVAEAKAALTIPVIASVNAAHPGSWSRYASMMADAGADAIELNVYAVAADPSMTAADVESVYLDVIREVRASVAVPLTVKLSPFFSSFAHFAGEVVGAGADGLVLFNRFYAPDIDLDELRLTPTVELSSPGDQRLPLRWLGILRSQLGPDVSLACTSGVHSADGVLKALLVGANVACTTAAVLHHGPERITSWLTRVEHWMAEREYDGVDQLRGSMSAAATSDPSAYERSQYVKIVGGSY
jgi:dihydroorotate dehydrogenase (fumarate)